MIKSINIKLYAISYTITESFIVNLNHIIIFFTKSDLDKILYGVSTI